MTPHDTFLELAAIAIDFPLATAERGRLDRHLAGCPACVRGAAAMRGDALALAHLPAVVLPERRGAAILAAALHPAAVRVPLRMLVLAALLGLLLLGSLAVGAQLLRSPEEDLSVLPPVPTASAPTATPNLDSPVGTLAVTHGEGGREWIELVTLDKAVTRLAEGRDPAWLSASVIVYTCPAAGEMPTGICAVGTGMPAEPEILITGADRPAPAPDGTSIAMHRGMIDVGETWLMAADGSNPRLLHTGAFLRWSPDGAWLAGQPEGAAAQVAIVGADGQGFRVLAPGYDPAWSPSGDRIAYALVDAQGPSLRTVDLSTGEIIVLVTAPVESELAAPAWLTDGRLLFVQDGSIRLFDPAQVTPAQVTTAAVVRGDGNTDPLAVSPYGGWVAYTNGTGNEAKVELSSIDGRSGRSFPWTGPVTQPAWAPKGKPEASPLPLGSTWQAAAMPVAVGEPVGRAEAVIAGGIGFLAVGLGCQQAGESGTCEGVVWRSADGKTWERVPGSAATSLGWGFPTSGPEVGMFDVALGGPGFVAIGYAARPTMEATTWFSPDGVTWERNPLGNAGTIRVNAVAWDGQRYLLVGEDRSGLVSVASIATATARAAAWTSTDGRSWSRVPDSPAFDVGPYIDTMEDPAGGGMSDIVAGPAGMVAVGSVCTAGGVCEPAVWTAPAEPANDWVRATDVDRVAGVLRSVAATGSGYVAVGSGTCGSSPMAIPPGCPAVIMYSTDAMTWKLQPDLPVSDLRTVTWIGDRFFATATSGPETVWVSADGTTWAPLEAEGGPSTATCDVGWCPDAGGEIVEWRFGADDVTAVWLGQLPPGDTGAWVSSP